MRKIVLLASLWFLGWAAVAQADSDLARIQALVQGGATGLALDILERDQVNADSPNTWMALEEQRFAIYAERRDWNAVSQHADQLPPGLPASFVRWALTQAAQARLAAGDAPGARRYLRKLIWQLGGSVADQARWRRLVIRSYLLEDDLSDAQMALVRYQQDFSAAGGAWQVLHGAVLLRAGQPRAAYAVLEGGESDDARILRALAALRGKLLRAPAVLAEAQQLARTVADEPTVRAHTWGLAAEAAARSGQPVPQVVALEHYLRDKAKGAQNDHLFDLGADDLWRAYDHLARVLGNRERLLVGNDAGWLRLAQRYQAKDAPQARAIYAFLARTGQAARTRDLAQRRLIDSLSHNGYYPVVRLLYTESERYPALAAIPTADRYQLAELAMDADDIPFAAKLMAGLARPPVGTDADLWSLRRARVLIYGGDYKTALSLLSSILDHKTKLDDAFARRYIQVLFDLQAVDMNQQAYVLLKSVYRLVDDPQTRRQLLFWMAESKSALGDHQAAAELYLRSANFGNSAGGDMWGQTARFYAAEELARAGLVSDARNVYERLLQQTTDPRRRAVIERKIEQLWLRHKQTGTS